MTTPPSPLSRWHPAQLLATWFGVGLLPVAPGTWGSLAALPFAWGFYTFGGPVTLAAAAVAAFAGGIWAAGRIERASGIKDPSQVVIDEVAGQWLALSAVAPDLLLYAIGFVLFRIMDIVKPWPASWIDRRMPGGIGIMLDDLVAGAYAGIALYFIAKLIP